MGRHSWRRRNLSRRPPGKRRFRSRCFCRRRVCHRRFCRRCGRSRSRPLASSTTTSAAATTASRPQSRLNRRWPSRCAGLWDRLGNRLWRRYRGVTRLHYWNLGWSSAGLIIIKPGLQWLRRLGCFFGRGRTVSGLFAALQALAHPFAHIAACSTPVHTGAIRAPWRPGYLRN